MLCCIYIPIELDDAFFEDNEKLLNQFLCKEKTNDNFIAFVKNQELENVLIKTFNELSAKFKKISIEITQFLEKENFNQEQAEFLFKQKQELFNKIYFMEKIHEDDDNLF